MKDVYYNDTPFKDEIGKPLRGEAFAGEYEPVTLALVPLQDLGKVTRDRQRPDRPGGHDPRRAIDVGFVSYRISRVTMEGSVYTISPRLIMPTNTVDMPKDIARRFWLTVKTPPTPSRACTRARSTIKPEQGGAARRARGVPRPHRHARPGGHPGRPVGLHDRHPVVRRRPGRGRVQPSR